MSGRDKVLTYLVGFGIGCVILLMLPREAERPERHPWHEQTAPEDTYPMEVTDDLGRKILLERQPRHFISLAPSVTEMLFAMEMGDHLMAVTQWCAFPEEAKALRDAGAQVGSMDQPNRELIAAYRPDLVIGTDFTPPELYAAIQAPPRTMTVCLKHESMDDILEDIRMLGKMTGVPGHALRLVTRLQSERARIEQQIHQHASEPRKRVLFLLSIEEAGQPGWAPGANTWIGGLIEASHADNVAAELSQSWGEISLEALLSLDPEVVLVRAAETPAGQKVLEERLHSLATHPVWREVNAVQSGNIRVLPHGPLNIPGPRVMEAYAAVAEAIWADASDGRGGLQ